jgi:hypothetical protein
MQISQLSVSYVAEEDRLLLRLGFGSQEALFWLTRRFVSAIWPELMNVSSLLSASQGIPVHARQEVAAFQREVVLAKADFKTGYDANREPVWKEGPVLAHVLVVQPGPNGLPMLSLHNAAGVGVDLVVDAVLHAGLNELLRQAVVVSGWDLNLHMGKQMRTEAGPVH